MWPLENAELQRAQQRRIATRVERTIGAVSVCNCQLVVESSSYETSL